MEEWDLRNSELLEYSRAGHSFRYRDLSIVSGPDVFSPGIGISSVLLADQLLQLHGGSALDMGTGTLFLALVLRLAGFDRVVAVDNHEPALLCARQNLELNPQLAPVEIVKSDLFVSLASIGSFDLIVFNQPFYPITGSPISGMGSDGGAEISTRFLHQAKQHLNPAGRILMPFSDLAGPAHDPSLIALAQGYQSRALHQSVSQGHLHTIFEFTLQQPSVPLPAANGVGSL